MTNDDNDIKERRKEKESKQTNKLISDFTWPCLFTRHGKLENLLSNFYKERGK